MNDVGTVFDIGGKMPFWKNSMNNLIDRLLFWNLRMLFRAWRKRNRACNPRYWSNDELDKFGKLFSGDVINVSAGEDMDKEGDVYQTYFSKSTSYTKSNDPNALGNDMAIGDIELDLNTPLSPTSHLLTNFDVVFSHTVLEHVYGLHTAIDNLTRMTRDIVITVVPHLQSFHHREEYYADYWRLSPYAIVKLFNQHHLKTIYISWSNDPIGNIYIFHIASKHPEKWEHILTQQDVKATQLAPGYRRQQLLSGVNEIPAGKINTLGKVIHNGY